MKKQIVALIVALALLIPTFSYARKSSSGSSYKYKSYKSSSYKKSTYKKAAYKPYKAPKNTYKPYKAPKTKKTKATTSTKKHNKNYCATCPRDKNGHIKRSSKAKKAFMKQTGYPHGRPGYVIDHIKPLKDGGADDPSNMQWQTVEQAKAKDKIE